MRVTIFFAFVSLVVSVPQPIPGHLPPTKYNMEQQFSSSFITWRANGVENAPSVTFSNLDESYVTFDLSTADVMDISTDHPSEYHIGFDVLNFEGAPELTLFFFEQGTIHSQCPALSTFNELNR